MHTTCQSNEDSKSLDDSRLGPASVSLLVLSCMPQRRPAACTAVVTAHHSFRFPELVQHTLCLCNALNWTANTFMSVAVIGQLMYFLSAAVLCLGFVNSQTCQTMQDTTVPHLETFQGVERNDKGSGCKRREGALPEEVPDHGQHHQKQAEQSPRRHAVVHYRYV